MLNSFGKNKKEKKRVFKIKDVVLTSKNNTVRLKEKTWKLEFKLSDLKRNFSFNRRKYCFVFGFIIFLFFGGCFWWTSRAETAYFYPNSVLGGWENPQNAQGVPENQNGGNLENFNENNSAVLRKAASQIFLGNFQGNLPEGAVPQKVYLKAALAIKDENKTVKSENFLNVIPSPSDFQKDENIFIENLNQQKIEKETPSSSPEVSLEISPSLEPSALPSVEPKIDVVSSPTVFPEISPESSIIPETNNLLNFIKRKILNAALAEESDLNKEEKKEDSTIISEEKIIEPSSSFLPENSKNSNLEIVSESPNPTPSPTLEPSLISTSNPTPEPVLTPNISEFSDSPFLEVFCTFGDNNWKSLGKINRNHRENLIFEIADFQWENLDKFQVSFQSLPFAEQIPTVFLDGVWLEVEYEPKESEQPTIFPEPTPKEEKSLVFKEPKGEFYFDEEPEFVLLKSGNFSDGMGIDSQSTMQIKESKLLRPGNKETVAAAYLLEEKESYKIKIKKGQDFEPGDYHFEASLEGVNQIYKVKADFSWKEKYIPKKSLLFSLENLPIKTRRLLRWLPENFEGMKNRENNQIDVGIVREKNDSDSSKISVSGNCQKKYFVILIYANQADYEKNPFNAIYNKAFLCESGKYKHEFNDLPTNIPDGTYYILVAQEDETGPWEPISALQPIAIKTEMR